MSRGMKFSLRPALVVAILAHLSENRHLAERARQFLESKKGKWINLKEVQKIPEVLSEENVKLLFKVKQFLTPEEADVYDRLYKVHRIRIAAKKTFGIKLAHLPDVKNVYPDFKFPCTKCGFKRSFTLLTEGDMCGSCLHQRNETKYEVVASGAPNPDENSNMVACRECSAIYEVVKTQDLRVDPKCHYCRFQLTDCPTIRCRICLNKFVNPSDVKKRMGILGEWTCAICVKAPARAFDTIEATFADLVKFNRKLLSIFGFTENCYKIIYGPLKNFKLFTDCWTNMSVVAGQENIDEMVFNGRQVFDYYDLLETVKSEILLGALTGMCLLCCEDKSLRNLQSPCGHCKNDICFDCISTWVNQIKPGKLVLPSHLMCPFCKQPPNKSILERFNKEAKALNYGEHLKNVLQRLQPDMFYGWCKGCAKIQEIGAMTCGAGADMPFTTTDNFVCDLCKVDELKAPNVPKCPGCEAPTVKTYGCNHIQCPVCNTHWCYVCHKQFDYDTIYDHLISEHGNIGLEDVAAIAVP